MKNYISLVMAFFLMSLSCANAEDSKLDLQDIEFVKDFSLKFARCSGTYEMVSAIHSVTDAPALAKNTQEVANGAKVASAYLIASAGIIPDWQNALQYSTNSVNSEKLRWEARVAAIEDKNKVLGELTESLKECNKLGNLQDDLVQKVRIWAYSQPEESKKDN